MLSPILSLSDVYGPGNILVPRAHQDRCKWLSTDPCALDSLTGVYLHLAGGMPVVCSEGFNTPAAFDLLAMAGLTPTQDAVYFGAGDDMDGIARASARWPGRRIVVQHVYPRAGLEPERCWIDPALLEYLNNKANLGELAPSRNTPERRTVDRADFLAGTPKLPVVLKLVSDESSGGGAGVIICRASEDLEKARDLFAWSKTIVAEALLDIVANPCLNFAILSPDDVRFIGFAEQEIGPDGKFRGNWIDLDGAIGNDVVGPAMAVARRAAALGYRGFAGIDMAVTRDGGIFVLDLNFRMNASTPALLFGDAVKQRWGASIAHSVRLQDRRGAARLAQVLAPFVETGRVLPLSLFDPKAAGHDIRTALVHVLIAGTSRQQVLATERELAALGIAATALEPDTAEARRAYASGAPPAGFNARSLTLATTRRP